jgi:hypothetical protein
LIINRFSGLRGVGVRGEFGDFKPLKRLDCALGPSDTRMNPGVVEKGAVKTSFNIVSRLVSMKMQTESHNNARGVDHLQIGLLSSHAPWLLRNAICRLTLGAFLKELNPYG